MHGKQREEYRDMVPGTIISSKSDGSDDDGDGMSIRIHGLGKTEFGTGRPRKKATSKASSSVMVNYTPLGSSSENVGDMPAVLNVNPALNNGTGNNVQVMNLLDGAPAPGSLEQLAMVNNSWLEGIPGGMFDWGACCYLSVCLDIDCVIFQANGMNFLRDWETMLARPSLMDLGGLGEWRHRRSHQDEFPAQTKECTGVDRKHILTRRRRMRANHRMVVCYGTRRRDLMYIFCRCVSIVGW